MLGFTGNTAGKIFNEDKFTVVKKSLAEGEKIEKHNHPNEIVLFIVVKGCLKIILGNNEEHTLEPGEILKFDGDNFICAEAPVDSEAFVTLIKK